MLRRADNIECGREGKLTKALTSREGTGSDLLTCSHAVEFIHGVLRAIFLGGLRLATSSGGLCCRFAGDEPRSVLELPTY